MKFRTEIEPVNPGFEINLHDGIMTIGSCFSEIIGNKLSENKLNCLSNPFGTVFNPLTIFKLLRHSLSKQPLDQDLFTENNDDYWNHFDFHSKFSADSRQNLEHELSSIYDSVFQVLSSAKVLIITLGTANVYELKSNNQVVANCHKQPQKLFDRRLLTLKEIKDDFQQFYDLLQVANNKIKIILTVSPVRHTRDGLNNNSVSKSILRTACHLIQQDNADVGYFPSYEIMMDDLRDYRFYKSDLIHPNEMAEQYIFERFSETHFSADLNKFVQDWQQIRSSLQHRPFKKESPAHQIFLTKLLEKLTYYNKKVNMNSEIEEVRSQLTAA